MKPKQVVCPKCGERGELHILSGASWTQYDYEIWHGVKEVRKKPIGPAQIPASVVTTESRCILDATEVAKLEQGDGKRARS